MKFFGSLTMTAVLVATAFAQGINIGAPAAGTTISAGSNFTVEIDRPTTLSSSVEVAVVIGFSSCETPQDFCTQDPEAVGDILYNGPYNPQFHTDVTPGKGPYQNFTVTIPSDAPTGPAQLSVVHFALIGAGPFPFLQTRNITINVD